MANPTKIENSSHVHYHMQVFGIPIAGAVLFILRGLLLLLLASIFRSVIEGEATIYSLLLTPSIIVLAVLLVAGHEWVRRWW